MMDVDFERFLMTELPNVELEEQYGFKFFFYGDDHRMPFATMISADTDYDKFSDLNRPGVFRLNIGVSRQTFQEFFGQEELETSQIDYRTLDTFMPHPDYWKQNFICILSPGPEIIDLTLKHLKEAHALAEKRHNLINKA